MEPFGGLYTDCLFQLNMLQVCLCCNVSLSHSVTWYGVGTGRPGVGETLIRLATAD